MVGSYQSEAELPWAGKCICNHAFVISSSPYSFSPCFFSFHILFQAAYHSLGPLLGEKHRMSVNPDLYICVRVLQLPELVLYTSLKMHVEVAGAGEMCWTTKFVIGQVRLLCVSSNMFVVTVEIV